MSNARCILVSVEPGATNNQFKPQQEAGARSNMLSTLMPGACVRGVQLRTARPARAAQPAALSGTRVRAVSAAKARKGRVALFRVRAEATESGTVSASDKPATITPSASATTPPAVGDAAVAFKVTENVVRVRSSLSAHVRACTRRGAILCFAAYSLSGASTCERRAVCCAAM